VYRARLDVYKDREQARFCVFACLGALKQLHSDAGWSYRASEEPASAKMPGKKSKSKKKGKSKSKKKANSANVPEHQRKLNAPEEMLMSRLQDVASRSQEYATRVEQLQATAKKRGHDAMEHYHYLNETVKRQEKDNKAILESLKKLTNDSITDKATLKQQFEDTLKRVEAIFLQKEDQLLSKNKQLMKEVSDLSLYKKMRHDLAKELGVCCVCVCVSRSSHVCVCVSSVWAISAVMSCYNTYDDIIIL
jgi:DNA repair exonuclease SbcCD ATPase subunit